MFSSQYVYGIVMFSFENFNDYFVNCWAIAKRSLDDGARWGSPIYEHLATEKKFVINQVADPHGPQR